MTLCQTPSRLMKMSFPISSLIRRLLRLVLGACDASTFGPSMLTRNSSTSLASPMQWAQRTRRNIQNLGRILYGRTVNQFNDQEILELGLLQSDPDVTIEQSCCCCCCCCSPPSRVQTGGPRLVHSRKPNGGIEGGESSCTSALCNFSYPCCMFNYC